MATIKDIKSYIFIHSHSFFSHFHYRIQYDTYVQFSYQLLPDREGEQISYRMPDRVTQIKMDGHYYHLDRLLTKSHKIKAAIIMELKKRRKTKVWLDKEFDSI